MFWGPGTTLSTDTRLNAGGSNCGHGGYVAGGAKLSAATAKLARGRNRHWEYRETTEGLTAKSKRRSSARRRL